MTKTEELQAELNARGIIYDTGAHWKTLEKLLDEAKALDAPGAADLSEDDEPETATVLPEETIAESHPKPEAKVKKSATGSGPAPGPPWMMKSANFDPRLLELPTEPAGNHREGDKDPVVVEWRRKNWPAKKFAETYHHRGIS